jgi:hypothetical protein
MALKVIWSSRARKSFDELVIFLEKKWEEKVIRKLFIEVNDILKLISEKP